MVCGSFVSSYTPAPFFRLIMQCKICGLEVNTDDHSVPPKWFGKYFGKKLIDVICHICIKTDKGKELWR